MLTQLPLPIHLRDDASFANFYPRKNEKLIAFLKNQTEQFIYFWGHESVGCTHLLQAACQEFTAQGLSARIDFILFTNIRKFRNNIFSLSG
jgi:DnaA family protein